MPGNGERDRTAAPEKGARAAKVTVRRLQAGDDATAFRTLNEEWIQRHFSLEAKDRETLGDPQGTILAIGGSILMMEADGAPVGCVALVPMAGGVYELAKMAVAPQMRGRGLGRRLLEEVMAEARRLGAKSLLLGSSTRLPDAVHLYESMGFQHVPPWERPPMPYSRADVFMRMQIEFMRMQIEAGGPGS